VRVILKSELQAVTGKIREVFHPSALMCLFYLYACRKASAYHWASSMVNGISSRRPI